MHSQRHNEDEDDPPDSNATPFDLAIFIGLGEIGKKECRTTISQGSGWIWQNLLIMSCHHCVFDKKYRLSKVWVTFYDGRTNLARVYFRDPLHDIALLKVEEDFDAPIAKRTLKNDTEVEDMVILLGSGGGYPHAACMGILCHKRQDLRDIRCQGIKFLPIDCSIFEGVSGGLVINQDGVGIGMLQKGDDPFGFAIPLGTALRNFTQAIKLGKPFIERQIWLTVKKFGAGPHKDIYEIHPNLFERGHIKLPSPRLQVETSGSSISTPVGESNMPLPSNTNKGSHKDDTLRLKKEVPPKSNYLRPTILARMRSIIERCISKLL